MRSVLLAYFNKSASFDKRPELALQEEVFNEELYKNEMALYREVGAAIEESKLVRFARFLATSYAGCFEGRSLIEPNSGQVLYGRNFRTINTAFHPYELHDPLAYVAATPLASSILLNRRIAFDEALYLRDGWFNLYHFYFDVVPQLLMAQKKLAAGIPVIVPKGFRDKSFVEPVLRSLGLDAFFFVEQQPDQSILIRKKLYLLKDFVVSGAVIETLRKMTGASSASKKALVFLNRLPGTNRSLLNNEEVVEYFRSIGISTAYAENLSYKDQIALFSSVEQLYGLHGAGLANMVFMPKGSRLVEMVPLGYFASNLAIHYKRLAAFIGLDYMTVEGGELNASGIYELPISVLQSARVEAFN